MPGNFFGTMLLAVFTPDLALATEANAQNFVPDTCSASLTAMEHCGRACLTSEKRAHCSKLCIESTGIKNDACSVCLGQYIDCSLQYCVSSCSTNQTGLDCTSCKKANCSSCANLAALVTVINSSQASALNVDIKASSVPQLEALKHKSSPSCPERQGDLRLCGLQCFSQSDRATCSASCLHDLNYGWSCAGCLGQKIDCVIVNCLRPCHTNANSEACRGCVRDTCFSCDGNLDALSLTEGRFIRNATHYIKADVRAPSVANLQSATTAPDAGSVFVFP